MARTYKPKTVWLTPDGFLQWRKRQKLSKAQCCSLLGLAPLTLRRYEDGRKTVPKHIALACSAISFGLPPMPSSWP